MDLIECPVCNQEFDPEAQDGLCTNGECGKYRYEPGEEDAADTDGGETDERDIDDSDDSAERFCPSCGESAGDINYCTNCRHELGSIDETQECSACHETVPQQSYCRNCGAEFSTIVEPNEPVCPACDTAIDPDDNFCSECGEPLDDDSSEELVLEFKGREFELADGKRLGADLRNAAYDNGTDWDVARQIHRKHVEFAATDSGFDLIVVDQERERQNDTYLNGEKLAPGAREPLAAGDEIGFHNVGTGVVRED